MSATVSAIITTYNYARFIPAAIESVLNQTRRPDEIVVVDDGSTDETAALVAGYAARGVRYVGKENGGAGSARNRGLRETTGDLVFFLDADDQWFPDKVERQLAHLARYPAAGLVTGGECQVFEGGQPPYLLRRPPLGASRLYPQVLIENTIGNPSLTLVRRACFDRVGVFDEEMRLGQDWDMWIRIVREFPVGVVDGPLITFMRHRHSLTAGQVQARYESNRAIQRRYISQVRSPLLRLNLRRAAQSMNCYYTAAALADSAGRRRLALRYALVAAVLDPFYESRLKGAVLFRTLFGRAAFDQVRRLVRNDAAPISEEHHALSDGH
jgi:glycosyltransferase involved in cell wall biosynthesis